MDINIYTLIFYALVAVVFVWRIVRSYKVGFVGELANALSILIALTVGFLVKNMIVSYLTAKYGRLLAYLSVLAVVLLIYKLMRMLFGALKIFASLPVIKVINRFLGIILGAGEAFIIILFAVKVLRELIE